MTCNVCKNSRLCVQTHTVYTHLMQLTIHLEWRVGQNMCGYFWQQREYSPSSRHTSSKHGNENIQTHACWLSWDSYWASSCLSFHFHSIAFLAAAIFFILRSFKFFAVCLLLHKVHCRVCKHCPALSPLMFSYATTQIQYHVSDSYKVSFEPFFTSTSSKHVLKE